MGYTRWQSRRWHPANTHERKKSRPRVSGGEMKTPVTTSAAGRLAPPATVMAVVVPLVEPALAPVMAMMAAPVNLLGGRSLVADGGELAEHASGRGSGLGRADGDERRECARNSGCRNELDHHDTSLLIGAEGHGRPHVFSCFPTGDPPSGSASAPEPNLNDKKGRYAQPATIRRPDRQCPPTQCASTLLPA